MFKTIWLLAFLFPYVLIAQNDFSEIDKYAREAPSSVSSSIEELADYLTKKAANDLEKVRSLYVWMTENIRYDTKLYFDEKATAAKKAEKQKAATVLKTKRGVCEGYTNLFHELALAAHIPSEQVSGYTKNHRGRIARTTHAWNAVRIDEKWYLLDNTWGAGYIDSDTERFKRRFEEKYFMTEPSQFVLDHYPHDPLFQMMENPVTWEVWQEDESAIQAYLNKKNNPLFAALIDSLDYFNSLEGNEKVFNTAFRSLSFDPQNGYANFVVANYYYDEAKVDFDLYRKDSEPYTMNPKKLTEKKIKSWSRIISRSQEKLEKARGYLETIEPGNKFYRHSRSGKKNVNAAMVNIRKAKQQLGAFRDYLKKRGS